MRVVMFSDSYYPYISGVTRSIANTRESLVAMGHDVHIFCPNYPNVVNEQGIHRLPSIKAPTNSSYYVAIPLGAKLLDKVAAMGADVVHIHSPFNLGKAGLKVGRRMGLPVVFTYHTMYNMYSHYVPVLGRSVSHVVEGLALAVANSVDSVVTPSPAIADYLKERGVTKPITAIPNGIDVRELSSGDRCFLRRALGLPEGVPVVLTCGRLGAEKNLAVLLQSFALTAKESEAVLVLVGDGPLRAELLALSASLGVRDRTFFAGSFPPSKMADVYAGADLFLFASLTDTQGLVLVEAKAAGLPAVAVGALGVKDMVRHGQDGFLCENDPKDLSEKTLALLRDPSLRAKMSENAKKAAHAFSKESCAAKLLTCYESVIRQP